MVVRARLGNDKRAAVKRELKSVTHIQIFLCVTDDLADHESSSDCAYHLRKFV